MNNQALVDAVESLPLIDHHVHGVFTSALSDDHFEEVMTESDRPRRADTTNFDSQVGAAIRRWCAPLLDLEPFVPARDYLERRRDLGVDDVNQRMLRGAHLDAVLVDTGFATQGLTGVAQMGEISDASSYEVVRLEALAEDVVRAGVTAAGFADSFRSALHERLSSGAVGTKSIAAYRYGLDLPPTRPSSSDVEAAMNGWLSENEASERLRIKDPVLLSFLLWCGVDAGLPVQIHTGYGDSDLDLLRSNPAHLTDFIRACESFGTPIVLLHCYPYHREAAYLAQIFPHVFFDVGEGINYSGVQSRQLIAESFEIAPFYKQLYSSDGWGLVELHYLGARLWRNGVTSILSNWVEEGHWSEPDAIRVANMIGRDNAVALYQLDAK
jgi:uncharacterized protein